MFLFICNNTDFNGRCVYLMGHQSFTGFVTKDKELKDNSHFFQQRFLYFAGIEEKIK